MNHNHNKANRKRIKIKKNEKTFKNCQNWALLLGCIYFGSFWKFVPICFVVIIVQMLYKKYNHSYFLVTQGLSRIYKGKTCRKSRSFLLYLKRIWLFYYVQGDWLELIFFFFLLFEIYKLSLTLCNWDICNFDTLCHTQKLTHKFMVCNKKKL